MKDSMNAFALAEKFLEETRANTKEASLRKAATDPSDPTTQPVMKADDGTQPAREGSRSAENEADIRKALGSTGNTGQEDADSASSAKPTDTIGTVKQDADSLKGNAKQPKTEKDLPPESKGHPSNVTGKYASLREGGAKVLTGLISSLTKQAGAPVAEAKPVQAELKPKDASQPGNPGPVAGKTDTEKKAEAESLMAKEAEFKLASAKKYRGDAEAGYMAADLLATHLGFNKEANDAAAAQEASIQEGIIQLVKNAQADADAVCDFLQGQQDGRLRAKVAGLKFANEALASGDAAATGEGEGGMAPPPGMEGGAPPEAGGGGGAPGGAEGIDPEILQIVQALEAEGVTAEQIEAMLTQGAGGAGAGGPEGGMPPGAEGGMPPGMPPAGPEGGAEPPPGPEKTGSLKHSRAKLASALRRLAS